MTQYTLGFTRLLGHGRAFSQVLPLPDPAAGDTLTYTNTGIYWQILDSISFQLVTSSTMADRQVTLTIFDGSGTALATLPSASTQAASLTYQYTWSPEFSNFNTVVDTAVTSPLPILLLQPQYGFSVAIGNEDTTDQVSNVRVYAEQFVTGDQGYLLGVVEYDGDDAAAAVLWKAVTA